MIVSPGAEKRLMEFSGKELLEIFFQEGILLFRGFQISPSIFSDFVRKNTSRISIDPAREFTSDRTQLVDAGYDPVGLHVENGTTPFLPSCLWFFCEKAALKGSETTYCDGKEIWEHLSLSTKKLFIDYKITYKRTVSEQIWKKYLAIELNINDINQITSVDLIRVADEVPGLSVSLNLDLSVTMEYTVSAVRPTQFPGQFVFANSILGPSYNYEKPLICFENGEMIPDNVLEELKEVSSSLTKNIKWKDNDLVIIDNTRFMHGRLAIEDKNRRLHIAMGHLL